MQSEDNRVLDETANSKLLPRYRSLEERQYNSAVKGWLRSVEFDFAACFSVPNAVHAAQGAAGISSDATALSMHLRRYLNKLDRLIFKQAYKRMGIRVIRIVSLEEGPNVGWHAHAVFKVPDTLTMERLNVILRNLWLDQFKGYMSPRFEKPLYWGEPITGHYFDYALKHVGGNGALDIDNCVIRPQ